MLIHHAVVLRAAPSSIGIIAEASLICDCITVYTKIFFLQSALLSENIPTQVFSCIWQICLTVIHSR
jgi:hypothetical protein